MDYRMILTRLKMTRHDESIGVHLEDLRKPDHKNTDADVLIRHLSLRIDSARSRTASHWSSNTGST